jgi:hypothetical protein
MPEVLHPRSTAVSPAEQLEALSAAVRDPLWMLARQWQTGGLAADDTGSPVRVTLAHTVASLTDGSREVTPIEPWVEAERPPTFSALDHAALVALSIELVRRLRDGGVPEAGPVLSRAFPLGRDQLGAHLQPFAGRVPDPRLLHPALAAAMGNLGDTGSLPPISGLPAGAVTPTETVCRGWMRWVAGEVSAAAGPAGLDPPAWDPQRMEYSFALTAALPGSAMRLRADEYDGSGVDWYTFDRSADPAPAAAAAPQPTVELHPTPVSYPGMPRPRFWELEDGDVNLDLAADRDTAHAVLVSFAHRYANDWFVVPLTVAPGVCVVTALTVTDTFGTVTTVPAAAAVDGGHGPWRLWELTTDDDPAAQAGARLLVPPTPKPLSGTPVEDVLLVRDELANLAWAVERLTQDRDGTTVDRYQRYLRLRPASDPAFGGGARPDGRLTYRLGTQLPDYWYPLAATTDAAGRPLLTLATVAPEATGVSDTGVQGVLVRHAEGTALADEEVPREGAHVTRLDRLVTGGAAVLRWRARTKGPGLGEGSSGLRFDILE